MSKFQHLSISLEGIEFQSSAFFKQLVMVLEQHPQKTRASLRAADFVKLGGEMDAVVKKFTGLKTDIVWQEMSMNAYVAAPIVDANSAIYLAINEYYQVPGLTVTGVDYFVEKRGSAFHLDLKTGRVSGVITEQEFEIGAPAITYRKGELTDEELAAALLHEVGHILTMLECLDKTCSSNAVLTELDQRLRSGLEPKAREVVLEKAGKVLGFEREVVEDATKTTNDTVAITIFVGNALKRIRSSSGDNFFDINTWETLADQYVARQGGGRALATALDKMHAEGGIVEKTRSNITYMLFEVLKIVRTIVMGADGFIASALIGGGAVSAVVGATSLATGGLPFLICGVLAFLIGSGFVLTHSENSGSYATPAARLTRVRQQLVEQVKRTQAKAMPMAMQRQLLADIATLDDILVTYKQSSDWFNATMSFMSSSFKNRQASQKFQQALEALSMNDLFVKSLELKTAA